MNRAIYLGRSNGFATLLLTICVLMSVTAIAYFNASSVINQQQIVTNYYQQQQALDAARAGLEYAIVYLDANRDTVTNNQIISGTLSGGGRYQVQFTFMGGKDLIALQSTGSSNNGDVNKIAQQHVKFVSAGGSAIIPDRPLSARGNVRLSGNAKVDNLQGGATILAGSDIAFSGNAITSYLLANGTQGHSSRATFGSDLHEFNQDISMMNSENLQTAYLGQLISSLQLNAAALTPQSSNHEYANELVNARGIVLLTQTGGEARISGNTVLLGSESNPLTLIVNGNLAISGNGSGSNNLKVRGNIIVTGDLKISGNATVEGLVFVLGANGIKLSGNAGITGAVVSAGTTQTLDEILGNARIVYDASVLQNTMNSISTGGGSGTYGAVPGSWRDVPS